MAFSVKTKNNELIKLEDAFFASGGEGVIHTVVSPAKYKNCCVKIYKDCISTKKKNEQAIKEREDKISYMVQNPPSKLNADQWLLTWPKEVIYEQSGNFLGFIMPLAFDNSVELFELTNIKTSLKLSTQWDKFDRASGDGVKRRLMLNANISLAVHHLHATNKYVIVDMKPQNFLVSPDGKVTVLDIDTVQISNNGSVIFPSKAMTAEYLPPESKNLATDTKIQADWDRFILGIIFYEVLFGVHPFAGAVFNPPYDTHATLQDKISHGLFPFGSKSSHVKLIGAKGHSYLQKMPNSIQNLFVDTFDKGLNKPNQRPSAETWGQTIYAVIQQGRKVIPQQKNIIGDKQREIDWQNCDKSSIQSLLDFRKKYSDTGKYTQKALQLINDIRVKNNQAIQNVTIASKPIKQSQKTKNTPSNIDLKRRVNHSLTYSILAVFLNVLFGLIAVIFSVIAKKRHKEYNYSACEESLKTAKVFRWISFVMAILFVIVILQ
jgi:DNA-binding helix-hairpin-helix protein with protein kinase domain